MTLFGTSCCDATNITSRRTSGDATKHINQQIERRIAGQAARAGEQMEMGTLESLARDSCRDLRQSGASKKKRVEHKVEVGQE